MNYIETKIRLEPSTEENFEILIALLGEIGYESFKQTDNILSAYIQENEFDKVELKNVVTNIGALFTSIQHESNQVETKNWNEEWEKNFDPIFIDDICLIKAPFHKIDQKLPYTITIEPKMSFGTGHHSTTSQMIKLMADIDFNGMEILDMGCGTGVLAIFAFQKGAKKGLAIDIDSWAYENTIENIERNQAKNIEVLMGDANLIEDRTFNIVLANINRNILLNDIESYVKTMLPNGKLLLSGFYTEDLPIIQDKVQEFGLKYKKHITDKNWVAALFTL